MKKLDGQIAIITGSGTGIGLAIAKKFLENGAKVLINDLNTQTFEYAKSILIEAGIDPQNFAVFFSDVSNETDVKNMFNECENKFGSATILVNNAGIIQEKKFLNISNKDWDRMMLST